MPMKPPVSVCHQVSTIAASLLPHHLVVPPPHLGLDGLGHRGHVLEVVVVIAGSSAPTFLSMRIVVGAVWNMLTPRRSAILHGRPGSGYVGTPS